MRLRWWMVTLLWGASVAHAQAPQPSTGEPPAPLQPVELAPTPTVVAPQAEELSQDVQELSQSELDALGLNLSGPRVDTSFHFWGFADFSSGVLFKPEGAQAIAQGRYQSFYVGNINLYLSKNLSETFRTMGEVRFTYLPNGSFELGSGGYGVVDTSTVDYANYQSLTRWGGIIMQRLYLEWTLHRFVTVRGGQYLTPFGIWNVDHGSPAVIPVQRPLPIVRGLYPERQTGFEIFGRWSPSNRSTLGYSLTLSNGTGPVSEYKDLDRNKAVGGRLYWEHFSSSYLRVGVSGYYGRDTATNIAVTTTGGSIGVTDKVATQADDLTLGGDIQFKRGGVTLQSEWITQQTRYTDAGRAVHTVFGAPVSSAASADTFSWGGYGLAAYRFSWFGITPFFTVQAGKFTLRNQTLPDARYSVVGLTGGLNISPIDAVRFKLEFVHARFPSAPALIKYSTNGLFLQAAWAF